MTTVREITPLMGKAVSLFEEAPRTTKMLRDIAGPASSGYIITQLLSMQVIKKYKIILPNKSNGERIPVWSYTINPTNKFYKQYKAKISAPDYVAPKIRVPSTPSKTPALSRLIRRVDLMIRNMEGFRDEVKELENAYVDRKDRLLLEKIRASGLKF